jgi:hypothetical protein
VTPYGDERVHGEERDIVPDKEKEEVHAHKKAENPRDQQEEKAEEFLYPMIQFPHGQNACEMDDAGEKNEGEIEAVRSVEVGNSQRWNPRDLFDELETSLGLVVGQKRDSGQNERNAGGNCAYPPDELLAVGRNKKGHQKPGHAAEKNHRENGKMGHPESLNREPDGSPLQETKSKQPVGFLKWL